jgi:FixJ family two-component response regulator
VKASRGLVAIVDDEAGVGRAFSRLVRSAGFEAEVFHNGEDFLSSLTSHHPCCAVLDLHMPDVDGFEIQSRMTKAGSTVPVVVVTGYDTSESRSRVMAGGAVAYLRKPVDDQALLDAIEWAMAGSRRNPE